MARILVIDDTKNIRKMVGLTLAQAGHQTECAEDGQRGLELFGDGAPWDLSLIDQQMPGAQGHEVIAEARRRDPLARLIMMTAFATGELAAQVLEAGALDFLRKPFTTEVLRGAVEAALAQPRQHNALPAPTPEGVGAEVALPEPGQPGFRAPRTSWRMNGFSFWPASAPQVLARPHGLEFGRLFQVSGPGGRLSPCFVAITAHVREQLQREAGREVEDGDALWEEACAQALLRFVWDRAEAPPPVLPVYEAPGSARRRGLIPWGPFGG